MLGLGIEPAWWDCREAADPSAPQRVPSFRTEPLAVSALHVLQPPTYTPPWGSRPSLVPRPLGLSCLSPASATLTAAVSTLLSHWPGGGREHQEGGLPLAAGRGPLPGHRAAGPWQPPPTRSQSTAVCRDWGWGGWGPAGSHRLAPPSLAGVGSLGVAPAPALVRMLDP